MQEIPLRVYDFGPRKRRPARLLRYRPLGRTAQLHVEFIPRIAKVLIIWKNAYARIALSQSMVPTTHS